MTAKLHLIEKPAGFDLRDRRSTKADDAELWTPEDALFDAAQAIITTTHTVPAAVVLWIEVLPDGTRRFKSRVSGEKDTVTTILMGAIGDKLGWSRP